ncbi:MAG TPA: hypothetical protein PLR25_30245, partial [Planctomycetaceae bacterium]|nr:hypothetical protein [Planctomycetaceae bacterium]
LKRNGDRTTYADFRVIGMGRDDKDVQWKHEFLSAQFRRGLHSCDDNVPGFLSSLVKSQICGKL